MNRAWVGVALLSGSWLVGLGYYQPAQLWAWAALVGLAPALLTRVPLRLPGFQAQLAAVGLCLPAIWLMPLPHKAIPLLMAAGLGLQLVPLPLRWPRRWGHGAAVASLVLLAQSLTVWLYEVGTAHRHELPGPLAQLLLLPARWLGLDATLDRGCLVIRCLQENTSLAATWDLLLDPASLCFLVGGCVLASLALADAKPPAGSWKSLAGELVGAAACDCGLGTVPRGAAGVAGLAPLAACRRADRAQRGFDPGQSRGPCRVAGGARPVGDAIRALATERVLSLRPSARKRPSDREIVGEMPDSTPVPEPVRGSGDTLSGQRPSGKHQETSPEVHRLLRALAGAAAGGSRRGDSGRGAHVGARGQGSRRPGHVCRTALDLGAHHGPVRHGSLRRSRILQLCGGVRVLRTVFCRVQAAAVRADRRGDAAAV